MKETSAKHAAASRRVAGFFVSALLWISAAGSLSAQDHDGHSHANTPDVPTAAVHKQAGALPYSERTLVFEEGVVPSPPYLEGFRSLDPSGPVGSYLLGSYLGSAEMFRHVILFPQAKVQFAVNATAGPDDLALAIAAPWPALGASTPDSLLISVALVLDSGDSLHVPVTMHPSRSFFAGEGSSRTYSLPNVLVLDLPEGLRTVTVRVDAEPSSFAIVTAGIPIEPDGESSPVPLGGKPEP